MKYYFWFLITLVLCYVVSEMHKGEPPWQIDQLKLLMLIAGGVWGILDYLVTQKKKVDTKVEKAAKDDDSDHIR